MHPGPTDPDREQTDYDKIRRIPFLYLSNMLTGAATLAAIGAPLTLFATELGFGAGRIGLLGGIMPFFQILGVVILPLIMHFGCKRLAVSALFTRYIFLLLFLAVPFVRDDLDKVFFLLFTAMALFSVGRTIAEAAYVPWSQEFMPKIVRGRILGQMALIHLPVALATSFAIKIWLDSQSGLDRFYPIFLVAIVLGLLGAVSLSGLGGGQPRAQSARGLASIRSLLIPLRDKNFLMFLYSSGTQFMLLLVIGLFLVLFFKVRLEIASGQLVFMSTFGLVGGAIGSYVSGWLVDRLGARGIRISLQVAQAALLLTVPFITNDLPGVDFIVVGIFTLFGFLISGSITAGNVYMLNYVPPQTKESYMALAYSIDGAIAGGATFAAGILVNRLEISPITISGISLGGYETLFVCCAVMMASSAIVVALLKEEDATSARGILSLLYSGNPLRVLWAIHSYGSPTSEERRRELAYGFGGTGNILAKEELLEALSDPSFDVRYEAIQALGHLPASTSVINALETMLTYDGLVELQYAALSSLGRINATGSSAEISRFLDYENPLLRSRAIRSLGDIRHTGSLPRIRDILNTDKNIDSRLAAVSALGKLGDQESVDGLLGLYCELVADTNFADEPRSKVILLALSKILDCEEGFSQEWRREEKFIGLRLPKLIVSTHRLLPKKSRQQHPTSEQFADDLTRGNTLASYQSLQLLRPSIVASTHPNASLVLKILDGTKIIDIPHRALLILLCIIISPVVQK